MDPSIREALSRRPGVIGEFQLLAELGQGGMGAVFKARQAGLDRVVALKVLPPALARDPVFIERLQREARATAKLNHPNIVQGIALGRDEGTGLWYFAMELVDGPSLRRVLEAQEVLPERRVLEIARDIAKALECAQRHGVVHRDIKPDNILLAASGAAKLADLGLSLVAAGRAAPAAPESGGLDHADPGLTQSGTTVGTPYYMSPEQIMGGAEQVDIRSDIYSLGCTLFHLLTGKPPYRGSSADEIMEQHLVAEPPLAQRVSSEVSEAAGRLIRRMMERAKEERYQTPAELLEALEWLLEPTIAPKPAPREGHSRINLSVSRWGARMAARKRQASTSAAPFLWAILTLLLAGVTLAYATGHAPDLSFVSEKGPKPEPEGKAVVLAAEAKLKTAEKTANKADPQPAAEPKAAQGPAPAPLAPPATALTPTPPPQVPAPLPALKPLLQFDFDSPAGAEFWDFGTLERVQTCEHSPGSLKALSLKDNKWFYCFVSCRDPKMRPLFTVSDQTVLGFSYFLSAETRLKVQMSVRPEDKAGNLQWSMDRAQANRWVSVRLRIADAFCVYANGEKHPPPLGAGVLNVKVFGGAPGSPCDLFIDNLTVSDVVPAPAIPAMP